MGLCSSKPRASSRRRASTVSDTSLSSSTAGLSHSDHATQSTSILETLDWRRTQVHDIYTTAINQPVTEERNSARAFSERQATQSNTQSIPDDNNGPIYIIDEDLIARVPVELWNKDDIAQCVYPKMIEAFFNILKTQPHALIFIVTDQVDKINHINNLLSLHGVQYENGVTSLGKSAYRRDLRSIAPDDTQTISLHRHIRTKPSDKIYYYFPEGKNLQITKNLPTDEESPEEKSIEFPMLKVRLPSYFNSYSYTIPIDYALPGYKFFLEEFVPKQPLFAEANNFSSESLVAVAGAEDTHEQEQKISQQIEDSITDILYRQIVNILACEENGRLFAERAQDSTGKPLIITAIKTALQKQKEERDAKDLAAAPRPSSVYAPLPAVRSNANAETDENDRLDDPLATIFDFEISI